MTDVRKRILERFASVKPYRKGERRAPHKPLLLMLALARLQRGQTRLGLEDVAEPLTGLLDAYAPPVKGRHQPELPFWYLRFDGIWDVEDADAIPLQRGGFPRMNPLRSAKAGLASDVLEALQDDPFLIEEATQLLLDEFFEPTLHAGIRDVIGLQPAEAAVESPTVRERAPVWQLRRYRDPAFRKRVLEAYDFRCAVTGFRAELGGQPLGCEAAHVQWHAERGPDVVENGLCLEPTLHLLLDAGAWTLTDDRRVIVSARYRAEDDGFTRLRERHGRRLRDPERGEPAVSAEFIRWHRDADKGGVFREPALVV